MSYAGATNMYCTGCGVVLRQNRKVRIDPDDVCSPRYVAPHLRRPMAATCRGCGAPFTEHELKCSYCLLQREQA